MTASSASERAREQPRVLLIGNDEMTGVTQRTLRDAGAIVTNLRDPSDAAIRTALQRRERIDTVVVISKDDHVSLRSALVVEGVAPGIALVVTVFDHDVASKLAEAVRNVRVISMADVVVPSIAAACLDHSPLSLHRTPAGFKAVRPGSEGPEIVPLDLPARGPVARAVSGLGALARPFDLSAKILVGGLLGFFAILVLELAMTMAFQPRAAAPGLAEPRPRACRRHLGGDREHRDRRGGAELPRGPAHAAACRGGRVPRHARRGDRGVRPRSRRAVRTIGDAARRARPAVRHRLAPAAG